MRLLFLWVPKAAGTSIWWSMEQTRLDIQRVPPHRFRPEAEVTTFEHVPLDHVVSVGAATEEWIHSAEKFAVVRNTWERLVSVYHGLKQLNALWEGTLGGRSFSKYIEWVCSGDYPPPRPGQLSNAAHWAPLTTWLKIGGQYVDATILRHESLGRDWQDACWKLGLPASKLPRMNPSRHEDYHSYYTSQLRDLVARCHEEEIDRFGFTF